MRDQKDTEVGKKVYLYLEGKKLELLKKKVRPKNAIIIPAIILENCGKKKPKIIAVCTKKLFYSKAPYGGHGTKLKAADTCIITEEEFEIVKKSSEEEIIHYCELNGFDYKKFKTALKAYRPKSKEKK